MKSCLKSPSIPGTPTPSGSSTPIHYRKCVLFREEGTEEVHWADEWDRTPSEPARRLSYQELLELKEIQQSLPHADQPADLFRPAKHVLSNVPIGLLPIFAAEHVTRPAPPLPKEEASTAPTPFMMPPGRSTIRPMTVPPKATRFADPALTHLRPPAAPAAPRPRPAFTFLPLLANSPAPSPFSSPAGSVASSRDSSPFASPPPTPTSDAASPAYPPARAAAEGEADRFPSASSTAPLVSPLVERDRAMQATGTRNPVHGYEHAYRAAETAAYSPNAPFGSSAYNYSKPGPSSSSTAPPSGKKKKKSYMIINDVPVEIGEETDDEDEVPPPTKKEEPPISTPGTLLSPPASPILVPSIPRDEPAKDEPPIPTPSPTSPRLAASGPAPGSVPGRPLSPLTTTVRPGSPCVRASSPVQARASSRLVRV
ncbi:hypothetical protein FB45DRAFT_949403 [Roridomyces roridus]|uniref:Uncharacterized protein n=1 Tax=Roridomyces roridus TaxID=1738132 RepID=A0AAD7B133_9AGAR|nr:hypothetical protein FB45DRAFT_949403 [Roridomyces roridus]